MGTQQLVVVPTRIRYENEVNRATFEPLALPWRKRFLITNPNSTPLIRTGIPVISGPDSGAFQIYKEPGRQPVEPTFMIPTGAVENFSVDFCPQRRGTFDADIMISANAGTVGTPVMVTGMVHLHGIAPAAPAALCP